MRLLSRALFTFALLGGLAFGSYAFGKYVLSSRLFGNKGSKLNQNFGESALPRSGGGKVASSASASVEVLPEGSGQSETRPAPSRIIASDPSVDRSNASGDDSSSQNGGDSDPALDSVPDSTSRRSSDSNRSDEIRPRKKRKRRRPRPTPASQTAAPREEPVRQTDSDFNESPQPDVVVSNEGGSDPAPAQDTTPRAERIEPRRETVRPDSSDETPIDSTTRRRRRRTRISTPEPTPRERVRERVRIEPRRETPREESPVPVPEGNGGGGESPVPVPE